MWPWGMIFIVIRIICAAQCSKVQCLKFNIQLDLTKGISSYLLSVNICILSGLARIDWRLTGMSIHDIHLCSDADDAAINLASGSLECEGLGTLLSVFQKHLTPPIMLPLHEVTTFKSLDALQNHLVAAPSKEHSGLLEVKSHFPGAVLLSRPSKDGFARLDGRLGKIARLTPVFL